MGWLERLNSVRTEFNGGADSALQRETGVPVRTWIGYVYRYVAELAEHFRFAPFSLLLIKHYACVSAIYEWAATNEGDLADRAAFFSHHGGLHQAPSIGAFQGYPHRGAWALARDPSLRAFVRRDPRTRDAAWAQLDWAALEPPLVAGRAPGPLNGGHHPRDWPRIDGYSGSEEQADIAGDPFFSLIGKVQLSMQCAHQVAQVMRTEFRDRLPPQLGAEVVDASQPQSSDPVAIWLLALYEFADHDMNEVRKNLRKLVFAVEHSGHIVTLNPIADVERPRAAFRALGIAFAETFLYDAQRQAVEPLRSAG